MSKRKGLFIVEYFSYTKRSLYTEVLPSRKPIKSSSLIHHCRPIFWALILPEPTSLRYEFQEAIGEAPFLVPITPLFADMRMAFHWTLALCFIMPNESSDSVKMCGSYLIPWRK